MANMSVARGTLFLGSKSKDAVKFELIFFVKNIR